MPAKSAEAVALPPPRGYWDETFGGLLPWPIRTSSGKTESVAFTLVSRPSLLFQSLGPVASIIVPLLLIAGFFLLLIEIVSLIWSLSLTRTITCAVHDLWEGTRQVTAGNFSHRTPVRNKDQLGELAGSFNSMTEHVQRLIVEVREKEKLESELEIARQVQTRLFPKTVPKLKTLELAGLCMPSRFVSGDYYDFIPLDDRWTALALGDISGKGISAALVMASVQSALRAQLKFTGGSSNGGAISTATLMGRLSQQLYENTPPEKYATFFCSVYDDHTGHLLYTNAGHLPPILIRERKASTLEVSGTVVGLLPNASYEQQVLELQPGDLLAAFTDGIPEAENAAVEQFGEDRLAEILIHSAHKPLDEIIRVVIDRIRDWAHDFENQDDTTILLARRL